VYGGGSCQNLGVHVVGKGDKVYKMVEGRVGSEN